MMIKMTGPVLNRLEPSLKLYWDDHGVFTLEAGVLHWTLKPDELADLSRELMTAAVTKGS